MNNTRNGNMFQIPFALMYSMIITLPICVTEHLDHILSDGDNIVPKNWKIWTVVGIRYINIHLYVQLSV